MNNHNGSLNARQNINNENHYAYDSSATQIGEIDLSKGQSKVGEQLAMTLTGNFKRQDPVTMASLEGQQVDLGNNIQSFGNTPYPSGHLAQEIPAPT